MEGPTITHKSKIVGGFIFKIKWEEHEGSFLEFQPTLSTKNQFSTKLPLVSRDCWKQPVIDQFTKHLK